MLSLVLNIIAAINEKIQPPNIRIKKEILIGFSPELLRRGEGNLGQVDDICVIG